jgi:hypothetical protein
MTAIASAVIYYQLLQRMQHRCNTLCKLLIQRREFATHGYMIRYSVDRLRASPASFASSLVSNSPQHKPTNGRLSLRGGVALPTSYHRKARSGSIEGSASAYLAN